VHVAGEVVANKALQEAGQRVIIIGNPGEKLGPQRMWRAARAEMGKPSGPLLFLILTNQRTSA
jgi:hypothetical protein